MLVGVGDGVGDCVGLGVELGSGEGVGDGGGGGGGGGAAVGHGQLPSRGMIWPSGQVPYAQAPEFKLITCRV